MLSDRQRDCKCIARQALRTKTECDRTRLVRISPSIKFHGTYISALRKHGGQNCIISIAKIRIRTQILSVLQEIVVGLADSDRCEPSNQGVHEQPGSHGRGQNLPEAIRKNPDFKALILQHASFLTQMPSPDGCCRDETCERCDMRLLY